MDLERAVDTQRNALLRLLAGWVMAVEVLSCGPLKDRVPLWVFGFVSSVLSRAETAAWYLVIVSVRVLARQGSFSQVGMRMGTFRGDTGPVSAAWERIAVDANPSPDDAVSVDGLRARMRALRNLLEDLPGHALRLLQRVMKKSPQDQQTADRADKAPHAGNGVHVERGLLLPRIERPPDKDCCDRARPETPIPDAGREASVFGFLILSATSPV